MSLRNQILESEQPHKMFIMQVLFTENKFQIRVYEIRI